MNPGTAAGSSPQVACTDRTTAARGETRKNVKADPKHDMQDTSVAWPDMARRLRGEHWLILAFAVLYFPLVLLGYAFKTEVTQLTVMWPAVGLLLAMFILAPFRRWPILILVQMACEYGVAALNEDQSLAGGTTFLYMTANTFDAIVGALVTRSHLWRFNMVRVSLVLQFLLASAAGAAASATLGAALVVGDYAANSYLMQWQLWWIGNWLGSLVIAPVVLFWALPVRRLYSALSLRRRREIPLFAVALALSTWWLFDATLTGAHSMLQTPAVPLALLLAAAFRLPPRWSSLLALCTVTFAAALGSSGRNPFQASDPVSQIVVMQTYLVIMIALPLIVGMLVTSMRIVLDQVSASEARYRTFIELSSEAVCRVELDPPMPPDLPLEAQRQWLRDHATIAESNAAFNQICAASDGAAGNGGSSWQPAAPWCALYEQHLEAAAAAGYSLHGLRLKIDTPDRSRTFIAEFSGVLDEDRLRRIWCVARDVSEIVDLNTRLLRERERLKAYASQLVSAEERARRATAVDLHDGIGQSLTGMAMSLEVARMQAPQVAPLLDDVRTNLRRVQERTRSMIADLSPPGLYELGLAPALQWLVVHFRSQDKLRVQLECRVNEESIGMDLRVLIFKLVRELLRNVVKHSGVDLANVNVHNDAQRLTVEVTDGGRGFEWQMEMFGPRPSSFGLWSISDRVSEFGGRFSVDTSPGQGARFRLEFPLAG